jgi:regulator of RNase E activity RraA
MPLTPATREKLRTVSTATVAAALAKHGLQHQSVAGVQPVSRGQGILVGEAFTVRRVLHRPAERRSIEECPPGAVLMIESGKEARTASLESIPVARLMKRRVAGAVTDGRLRDAAEIARLGFPAYQSRARAPAAATPLDWSEINVPITCGGTPASPGDAILGDRVGVVVIPAHLVDEIAEEALEIAAFEEFIAEQVSAGGGIYGLYPPTHEQTLGAFAAWRKMKGR